MKNLIIGIIIGMMIATPLVWAAAAHRLVDTGGDALDINSDGSLTMTFQ